jgi:hypothetical protein
MKVKSLNFLLITLTDALKKFKIFCKNKYCNFPKRNAQIIFVENLSVHLVDDDLIMYKGRKTRLKVDQALQRLTDG